VLAATFGLPEQHRAVLALRELDGMSYADIGQVLDMSPSNVGVTLMRARLKLKGAVRMSYVDAEKLAAECQEMLPKLSAMIDGELSAAERERVERHLDDCPLCRLALEEMTEASKSYRALIPLLPPLLMRREVLHRFAPHGDGLEAQLESLQRPRTLAERWQRLPLAGKVALGVGAASAVAAVVLVLLIGGRLADAFRSPASNAGTAIEGAPTAPPSAIMTETDTSTGAVEATAGGERGGETGGDEQAPGGQREVEPERGSEPVTSGNDASELEEPSYEESAEPQPSEPDDPEYQGPPPTVVLPPREVMPSPSPSTPGPD
jgi:anti-sigma factor RsiW